MLLRLLIFSLVLCGWLMPTQAEDWPQWRGRNRDAKIAPGGLIDSLPEQGLPRKWQVEIGAGYSGPTVSQGRVYVTDRGPQDAEGEQDVQREIERVLCFDAETGDPIWQHVYEAPYTIGYRAGPRAAVTIDDGRAYSVGAMGHFNCLDAASGEVIWQHELASEYEAQMPIWGITASPLVYDQLVIQVVAAGDQGACLVAFDKETGEEQWRALRERAGYSSPIIIRQGDQDVLVCWTGESISGLNPKSGDVYWSVPMLPRNMPIGVPTPVVQGNHLFVSSFYDGSLLIRFDPERPAAEKVWHRVGIDEKNTDALHCMISNPIIKSDAIYGFDSYGELRCLDLSSGDRLWEDLTVVPRARWATVHTIRQGDREIMLNDQGELIFAKLSRDGFEEQSRMPLIEPTRQQLNRRGGVVWSHPAIANGHIYARNDESLICVSLLPPQ